MGFSHLGRAGHDAMEPDLSKYPIAVSLFIAIGIVVIAKNITDLVQ